MKKILNDLKFGWSFMRILRLLLAVILLAESFYKSDWMFGALGAVLLAQAIFNVGCCSGGVCDTSQYRKRPASSVKGLKSTTFTEVK